MKPKPLLVATNEMLADTSMTLREISDRSGIGYSWLTKFNQGLIPKPGVEIVQRLHDFLYDARDDAA